MGRLCIGLDIGSTAVRLVQLQQGRTGLRLVSFAVEPLPPGCVEGGTVVDHEATVAAVRRVVARARPRGRSVALAVSGHGVMIKRHAVPEVQPEVLDRQIAWEVDQMLAPAQRGDVICDHSVLRQNPATGEIEVLLVAARRDIVGQRVRVARESGLRPVVIDATAFSLHNCVEVAHGVAGDETEVVIGIGASAATIAVITEGLPSYGRDLGVGGRDFDAAIQRTRQVAPVEAETLRRRVSTEPRLAEQLADALAPVAEEIAAEVRKTLAHFFETTVAEPVARVYLAGSAAGVPWLRQALSERLGVPVIRVDPFARVQLAPEVDLALVRAEASAAAVAFGLALRQEGDSP